jgi:hypothetical protein
MRTRDAFVSTDFSELNQLFLHLESGRRPKAFWWRSQVVAWCCTTGITEYGDMRFHVVSFIDRIFELDWNEERLHRLLDLYTFTFKLPTDVTLAKFLADVRSLIRADLAVHPVGNRNAARGQKSTRLHVLLDDKTAWNDSSWFRAQRYLLDHFNRLGMQLFVILAGCNPSGSARSSKTDAVKLLRERTPRDVLGAWDVWRGQG